MSTTEQKADPWSSFDYSTTTRKDSNMDPELASIVSSLSALSNPPAQQALGGPQQIGGFRRSSLNSNNGSDVESELIFQNHTASPTVRRSALSVGAAPTAATSNGHRLAMLGHYPASITTGALQSAQQGGSFFERFGRSLAEATREVEMNLGSTSSRNLRRDSVNNATGPLDILSIVPGATNISADEQIRRKTSVSSDTLDSVSESLSLQNEVNGSKNIWNVANAPVFRPNQMESVLNPEVYQSMYCGLPYGVFGHYNVPGATNQASDNMAPNNSTFEQESSPRNNEEVEDPIVAEHSSSLAAQFMFPPGAPLMYFPQNVTTNSNSPPPGMTQYQHSRYNSTESQKNKSKSNPYLHQNSRGYKSAVFPTQNSNLKGSPTSLQSNNIHHNQHYQPSSQKHSNSHQKQQQRHELSQRQQQGQKQTSQQQDQQQSMSSQHQSCAMSKRSGKNQQSIVRSPLLEEFRTNPTNKTYKLHEIYGSALEFCKDQHGSRFIQHELATSSDIEKEIIFNEIRDHAIELSHDVFGNYVIQKFFEYGTKTQKDILVEQFKGKLEMLSLEMYACRVIQRAFEFIDEDQKIELVTELSSSVLTMIKDQNGNHVIQKTIECIPMAKLPFIFESLKGQIYHLSTHFYGCRVVQRLLEYGSKEDQEEILNELDQFIPYLVQDQYGNYVIQHILQHGGDDPATNHIDKSKQDIVDTISRTVVDFSKHKFASNVVEKTILYGNPSQTRKVLDKILPNDEEHAANLEDTSPLILMMRDQYANYVVQKLVGVATGDDKKLIVIAIRSYLERLNKNNTLGNRHLASVEKLAALVEKVKI
ncbi:HHR022Wp [Eremothecium sinecaudum]|uniref:Pumilio homology domain family member 3 n=1 Tax=Eremothecium sinecaudum TaxID=45286 RepID=A0A0X8HWI1_9SACH|nr:HHR022Wp [Eremothecium sinecaudum]AMD22791.1 HHR022Wp [Eremothecium sinecaudum]